MGNSTATRILEVAREIVRNRGYSAFSYADISERIGIRKASIHYHFPSKEELVKALVKGYREEMGKACDRIAQSKVSLEEQVVEFAHLYRNGLEEKQICLCAMLAADYEVLPESIRDEIQTFFRQTEDWLVNLLEQGSEGQVWESQGSVEQEAKGLIALLQGAQLLARSSTDSVASFERVVYPLVKGKFSKG